MFIERKSHRVKSRGMNSNAKRRLRSKLWELQQGLCFWCGQTTVLDEDKRRTARYERATLDHLNPDNRGAGYDCSNIVLACNSCNSNRGNRTGLEFVRWITQFSVWCKSKERLGRVGFVVIDGPLRLGGPYHDYSSALKRIKSLMCKSDRPQFGILHILSNKLIRPSHPYFNHLHKMKKKMAQRILNAEPRMIEVLAYHLWEKAGRPISDGSEFWYKAERLLKDTNYQCDEHDVPNTGIIDGT